jgi:hypothetical protein
MYHPNQIVEYNGIYGRVIFHDSITYNVHVMFRTNDNTWKIEKCDQFFCKPAHVFLWTVESAFCTKYLRKTRTPQFQAVRVEEDVVMEI